VRISCLGQTGQVFFGAVTQHNDKTESDVVELFPRFTAGIGNVDFKILPQNLKCKRMRRRLGIYSCAVGFKTGWAILFGKYSARMLRAESPVQRNRILGLLRFMGNGLAGARELGIKGFVNPPVAISHLFIFLEVVTKPFVGLCTVLKALKVDFEFYGEFERKAVDHPGAMPCAFDQAALAQVSEMLRSLGLRNIQGFLEVTDTERTMCQ